MYMMNFFRMNDEFAMKPTEKSCRMRDYAMKAYA